jgi:polygalacturonase
MYMKSMTRVVSLTLAVVLGIFLSVPAAWAAEIPAGTIPSGIQLATGNQVAKPDIPSDAAHTFNILDYGAVSYNLPAASTVGTVNQQAIQAAIDAAYAVGGGTVVVPSGNFRTYTIHLKNNVRLLLKEEDSVIQAARSARSSNNSAKALNDGGNYTAPEAFFYARLQDQGHSHYMNSLIVAYDAENVIIEGPGLIDGSWVNAAGLIENELSGSDASAVSDRLTGGNANIANKAVALYKTKNVFLEGIRILNGGHFAIIAEGVVNMTVDGVLVDTNRDAFNVDCSQNVTIVNSIFNSLTDDAIVLKADFGTGAYMRTENVLIENCTVSGYDAGSVLYGTYTTDKLVATDRGGPTARIKLGTEGTSGFDRITVTGVTFDRSRGFALEAVDAADLTNIVLYDCEMYNVSSSPIFIRVGDRGRAPVTGTHTTTSATVPTAQRVRVGNVNDWVLPNMADKDLYPDHPTHRYVPEYSRSGNSVAVDNSTTNGNTYGNINISIVNETTPAQINQVNLGILETAGRYDPALTPGEAGYLDPRLFANAVGGMENRIARVEGIYIGKVDIRNVDPRYPITLAGLMDSRIKNVVLEDIRVEYRGGLTMKDATEQRQISTSWAYSQYMTANSTQSPPWLVNTFFLGNEGLLPRLSWNQSANGGVGAWEDNPYNIPERPREYPEPENFGILPAWGLWARHVDGLTVKNVNFHYIIPDTRDAVVLDDVSDAEFVNVSADGPAKLTAVTNHYKRPTNLEYVPETPYVSTTVQELRVNGGNLAQNAVTVNAPEPGTPRDSRYVHATYPNAAARQADAGNDYAYSFGVKSNDPAYSLPLTVYRPYFKAIDFDGTASPGRTISFDVEVRDPANPTQKNWRIAGHYLAQYADDGDISLRPLSVDPATLPAGASFTAESAVKGTFTWTPTAGQAGDHTLRFVVTDGLIPVIKEVSVHVTPPENLEELKLAWLALDQAMAAARGYQNGALYTEVSWAAFTQALESAQTLSPHADVEQIQAARNALSGAILALVPLHRPEEPELFPEAKATFTGPDASVVGLAVSYQLALADIKNLATVKVDFTFNSDVLTLDSVVAGSGFDVFYSEQGENTVVLYHLNGVTSAQTTPILQLNFAAKAEGSADVAVTGLEAASYRTDRLAAVDIEIDASAVGGIATQIKTPDRYDFNRDGAVTLADLATAQLWYMSNIEMGAPWSERQAADVDGNGLINVYDYIHILNYILRQ